MITYTRFYFVLFLLLTSILGFAQSTNSTKKEVEFLEKSGQIFIHPKQPFLNC